MAAKGVGPLWYPLTGGSPDSPAPTWHAWVTLGTGHALTPPPLSDPSGAGLWGFAWDAMEAEAEGWIDWGASSADRWERVFATAESATLLSGEGPSTGGPGAVVVGWAQREKTGG